MLWISKTILKIVPSEKRNEKNKISFTQINNIYIKNKYIFSQEHKYFKIYIKMVVYGREKGCTKRG